jgi:serine/threonine-protein kinase
VSDPVHPDSLQARLQRAIGPGYELVRVIGHGGMGQVWLAREAALRRLVAIKVLHPSVGASEVARRRFRRECELAAQLDHPGVVPVHRIGDAGEIAWFAMAFVDGETLAERLAREGRLPMTDALRLAREVADALAAAHRRGIVHRDVKPQNILLERDSGRALVSDFGIARALHPTPTEGGDSGTLTHPGSVLGTPRYMSPEQALGRRDVGPPSDLYSLGIILYEAIAGAYPYDEIPEGSAASAHLIGEVVWLAAREPGVPGRVDDLVRRLLD